jgi:hypothetical protein
VPEITPIEVDKKVLGFVIDISRAPKRLNIRIKIQDAKGLFISLRIP